jgi:predicted nucleic acid-binding Zn finger protein
MPRTISKGEIFWGTKNGVNNNHLLHPIVVMEDVDFRKPLPDKIKAVVLSTKEIKNSIAENVEMSRYHFEAQSPKKRYYKIRINRKRKEYLVCLGFLKCPTSLSVHEDGKLTPSGIEFVEKMLEERDANKFDYIPYTIKEYNEMIKQDKAKYSKRY